MTNEELLQQAKDQVINKNTFPTFDDYARYLLQQDLYHVLWEKLEKAALLSIQSARDDERKEWFEKGYQAGANPSYYGRHSTEAYERELKTKKAP